LAIKVRRLVTAFLKNAAVLLRIFDRQLSRRRVTGVESLRVEREATVVTFDEVTEPNAQVGAVGPSFELVKDWSVRALEAESAIIGLQRRGEETRGAAGLAP